MTKKDLIPGVVISCGWRSCLYTDDAVIEFRTLRIIKVHDGSRDRYRVSCEIWSNNESYFNNDAPLYTVDGEIETSRLYIHPSCFNIIDRSTGNQRVLWGNEPCIK